MLTSVPNSYSRRLVPDSISTLLVASAQRVTKAEDLDNVLMKAGLNVASSSLTKVNLKMLYVALTETIKREHTKNLLGMYG